MKCECGCGQDTSANRRFRQGHWVRTEEGQKNNSAIGKRSVKFLHTKEIEAKTAAITSVSNSKYFWSYSEMTPALAYIIGTYLTDGYIFNHASTIELQVVHQDFANKFANSIIAIQPDQHISRRLIQPTGKRKQLVYRVTATNKRLCSWLLDRTKKKANIPQELLQADYDSRISCFIALMDGDGGKNPYPYIATTYSWLDDAFILAKSIGLDPRNIFNSHILPNGKIYRKFTLPKPFHFTAPQKN
jgi:hypothetical protein